MHARRKKRKRGKKSQEVGKHLSSEIPPKMTYSQLTKNGKEGRKKNNSSARGVTKSQYWR